MIIEIHQEKCAFVVNHQGNLGYLFMFLSFLNRKRIILVQWQVATFYSNKIPSNFCSNQVVSMLVKNDVINLVGTEYSQKIPSIFYRNQVVSMLVKKNVIKLELLV